MVLVKNRYQKNVECYPAYKDALPSLPFGQLAYYTELDEEGAKIYLDFDLNEKPLGVYWE